MSNLHDDDLSIPTDDPRRDIEVHANVAAKISPETTVCRAFPIRGRRRVGPWVFFDHMGPATPGDEGVVVAPHPHIGLQTVTYMFSGEVLHKDSLGTVQRLIPGELNVMTAGRGISHSEESPGNAFMHGAQLWVALPESASQIEPHFEHHPTVPTRTQDGVQYVVIAGEFEGLTSPATTYSPILGVDVTFHEATTVELPIDPSFEVCVVPVIGSVTACGHDLKDGWLYQPPGVTSIKLTAEAGARAMVLGGPPDDPMIVWWNYVGRTAEEVAEAHADWLAEHPRFGTVAGWDYRINGPELVVPRLVAR